MLHTTQEQIEGKKLKTLGLVRGNSVKAKWMGSDLLAGIKNMMGGELKNYMRLMGDARDKALERMDEQAKEMGADAIVGVKFATSQIAQGAAEILVYGTAVKFR